MEGKTVAIMLDLTQARSVLDHLKRCLKTGAKTIVIQMSPLEKITKETPLPEPEVVTGGGMVFVIGIKHEYDTVINLLTARDN